MEAVGGTRSFRIRALSSTGAWTKWSPWLAVDAGPVKDVDVMVFPNIPGLFDDVEWHREHPIAYLQRSPTQRERVEVEPLAVIQLPSTMSLQDVAVASSRVPRMAGETDLGKILSYSKVNKVGRRAIRPPGTPPTVEEAGFLIKQKEKAIKVPWPRFFAD